MVHGILGRAICPLPTRIGQRHFVCGHIGILAVDNSFLRSYLTAYGLLLLASVITYGTGSTVYIFGTVRASRSIHGKLIEAILGTTLRCVPRCSYQVWWIMSSTFQMARHDPYVSSDYSCYSRYSRPYALPFFLCQYVA